MTSENQLAANRLNAQKSTGPKTESGRAISSMNALKHGALAEQILVQGHMVHESADEFKELCHEFYTDLAPQGALEETLVDQIVQATWRLRRSRRAESGEIALSVDGGWRHRNLLSPPSVTGQRPAMQETEEQTRQMANILPSTVVLQKILHYESVLQRQLFRAIHQLEKIQSRRQKPG